MFSSITRNFDRMRNSALLKSIGNRRASRITVAAIALVVLFSGYRVAQRRRPDHLWSLAEAALQAGDHDAARIHLLNLVRRTPAHTEALLALSDLEFKTAEAAGEPATYASQPRALQYLLEAARSQGANLDLRRRALNTCIEARRIREASVLAASVLEKDPDNTVALFAATFHAVDVKRVTEAKTLLSKLAARPDRPTFQTLALEAQLALDQKDDADLQSALDRNVDAAANSSGVDLSNLSADELSAMLQLFALGIDRADAPEQAESRLLSAIKSLESLPAAVSHDRNRPMLANVPVDIAQELVDLFERKFPIANGIATRDRMLIETNMAAFRQREISSGTAGPKSIGRAARQLISRGQGAEALRVIADAISRAGAEPANPRDVTELRLVAAQFLVSQTRYSEAEPHIAFLLADKELSGWGRLLSGNIALNQGRSDAALADFQEAEKRIGRTLLVRAALANTYLQLQRWSEALEQLKTLHVSAEELNADEQQWYADHLGSGFRVSFDEFRAQLALGRWDTARQTIKLLEGSELEPRAWVLAIGYLLEKDQPQQAMEWLAEGRRMFPEHLELLWVDLVVQERLGHLEAAEATLIAFSQTRPNHVPTQMVLGRWLMEHGQSGKAATILEGLTKAKNVTPEEAEIISLLYAQSLIQNKEIDKAMQVIGPLRHESRTAAAAGLLAATAQADSQNWTGVEQAIDSAIKSAPQPGALQVFRGELANFRGDYAEAVEALSPALNASAIRSHAQAALRQAVERLAETQGLDAAAMKVESLLEANPNDAALLIFLADLEMRRGRFDRSLEALDRLERADKSSPLGAFYKATARFARRELDMALTEIKRAIKIDQRHAPSLLLAAQIQLELGQLQPALTQATAAVRIDSRAWDAYLLQAEALKRLGHREDAKTVLSNTLVANPDYVAGRLALVWMVAETDSAESLKICRAGRERLPLDVSLMAADVAITARAEGFERASALAEELLANTTDAGARIDMAEAVRKCGFQSESMQLLTPIFSAIGELSVDKQLAAHLLAGKICLAEGNSRHDPALYSQARDHFAAVLKLAPHHLVAANNLIWLLATQLHQPKEAAELAARVQQAAGVDEMPVELIDTLATAYRCAGEVNSSHDLIDRAIAIRPNEGRLHFQLGMLLFDGRRGDEARQAFERALRLGLPDEFAREAKRLIATIDSDKLSQRE